MKRIKKYWLFLNNSQNMLDFGFRWFLGTVPPPAHQQNSEFAKARVKIPITSCFDGPYCLFTLSNLVKTWFTLLSMQR